jgi:ABC-type phosphonate transport system ATPase subunit
MSLVFVKPREGLRLRASDGTPIPPEGMAVARDHYIERRLAEGDLVLADEAPATPAAKKEKA